MSLYSWLRPVVYCKWVTGVMTQYSVLSTRYSRELDADGASTFLTPRSRLDVVDGYGHFQGAGGVERSYWTRETKTFHAVGIRQNKR